SAEEFLYDDRALACWRGRRWDKAIAAYQEAIRRHPDYVIAPTWHEVLAWLLVTCPDPNLRDPAQALEHARVAVQTNDGSDQCRGVGGARYGAGAWAGAVRDLERAEGLNPGIPQGQFFLAMAYQQIGDRVKARRWFDRAVQQKGFRSASRLSKEELGRFH